LDLATFASALLLALGELGAIRIDGSRALERGLNAAFREARRRRLRIRISSLSQMNAAVVADLWERNKLAEWCKVSYCWRLCNIRPESRLRDIQFCHLIRDSEIREDVRATAVAFLTEVYAPQASVLVGSFQD